jgi:c-di-GMP-binding flagellar brake protein YcgR
MFQKAIKKQIKKIQRRAIERVSEDIFQSLRESPVLKEGSEFKLNLFDSGIIINLSKPARRCYPKIEAALKGIIQKQLKKL